MSIQNTLARFLASEKTESLSSLSGKFHAHLTLAISEDRIDECRSFCRSHKVKLTTVDLENLSGRRQRDVMITSHYRDLHHNAVFRITHQLNELADAATEAGYDVQRAKLEHESTPSLPVFDRHRYHEVHVKLSVPSERFESDYRRLLELGEQLQFVPSRNPLQRDESVVIQFVNLRIYEGTRAQADQRVERVSDRLSAEGFEVLEVKRETVVYDTDQSLDQWWA